MFVKRHSCVFTEHSRRLEEWGPLGLYGIAQNVMREMMMKDYKRVLKPIRQPFTVKHGVRLKLYAYVRPARGVGNPNVPQKDS